MEIESRDGHAIDRQDNRFSGFAGNCQGGNAGIFGPAEAVPFYKASSRENHPSAAEAARIPKPITARMNPCPFKTVASEGLFPQAETSGASSPLSHSLMG
jgi:hypothetical protein